MLYTLKERFTRKGFLSVIAIFSILFLLSNVFDSYGAIKLANNVAVANYGAKNNETSCFSRITKEKIKQILEKGEIIYCKGDIVTASELEKLIKESAKNEKLHSNGLRIDSAIVIGDLHQ
ncbi:hypothetical protein [Candidatus Magnetomonas plexicatena]|uniref:hypothetical protein n=1 Tax=Candidatus Magnetomonas plexicatena TaxID=2552947 RepID=UPI0011012FA6|nr:hypothetical protein E2O03_000395 [Nitrospirales bacterium LBB_01]